MKDEISVGIHGIHATFVSILNSHCDSKVLSKALFLQSIWGM
jgi:hypothetical protein